MKVFFTRRLRARRSSPVPSSWAWWCECPRWPPRPWPWSKCTCDTGGALGRIPVTFLMNCCMCWSSNPDSASMFSTCWAETGSPEARRVSSMFPSTFIACMALMTSIAARVQDLLSRPPPWTLVWTATCSARRAPTGSDVGLLMAASMWFRTRASWLSGMSSVDIQAPEAERRSLLCQMSTCTSNSCRRLFHAAPSLAAPSKWSRFASTFAATRSFWRPSSGPVGGTGTAPTAAMGPREPMEPMEPMEQRSIPGGSQSIMFGSPSARPSFFFCRCFCRRLFPRLAASSSSCSCRSCCSCRRSSLTSFSR
mmetsp:Transcript_72980/g.214084  ORF Transcript_72980/g.214084 Transcript_72980/m.214084 type:complete len:309 (-) Transcript_72980:262-1188(-)